ncbi:hypothetical protein Cgig2_017931 [Carnegiea gigantea]|uniref:Uncharacterized protein n=1 Tax=Carnegiea gigantea TaxID=171969 RepID=A0A9Q1KA89_9CARY|nr:hypothetical protein Cgig2_017931 [Carnegiea gigantea]
MTIACRLDKAIDMPSSSSSSPLKSASMRNSEEDDLLNDLTTESSVTCIYQTMVAGKLRNIAVTWSKVSTYHSLSITIENHSDDDHQTCQIEFQSTQFWSRKGLKSLQVDDRRVDIFWDLKAVKFSTNPEPCSGYYIAVVFDKQMVLLLGDAKTEAYRRTMSKPTPVTPLLLHKEEILIGNNCFHTRMLHDDGPKEHDVVIENLMLKPDEPELRISIDGRMLVRVMNLKWRFRGNETALVNNVPVQIFWDVHDWLFGNPDGSGSSHALFIFKPGSLKDALKNDHRDRRKGNHEGGNDAQSPESSGSMIDDYIARLQFPHVFTVDATFS